MVAQPHCDIITAFGNVKLHYDRNSFYQVKSPARGQNLSQRDRSPIETAAKSLTDSGENRSHRLRFTAFGTARPGLVVPTIKVEMRMTDVRGHEPLQEQSGNYRPGERFG
jgi:hypothetical protein